MPARMLFSPPAGKPWSNAPILLTGSVWAPSRGRWRMTILRGTCDGLILTLAICEAHHNVQRMAEEPPSALPSTLPLYLYVSILLSPSS